MLSISKASSFHPSPIALDSIIQLRFQILLDAGAQVNPVLRTSKNVFMTPLDCALQRGFRSTAKFLQLHGGVPASKLANIQSKTEHVSSSTNLNIRDDVTLWGDSSDDERENVELPNVDRKKRSYKKKLKKEKGDGDVQTRRIKMKGTTSDEVLRYSSEVIVSDDRNGTINIEQNGEIVLNDKQKEKQSFVKSKIPVAAADGKMEGREKRPKSAKRTKPTSKTKIPSNSEKDTETTTKPTEELQNAMTTSTQESADTKSSVETVIENKELKTREILEEIVPKIDALVPQSKDDGDKQSLLSSTSVEEGEKHVVVEAYVHSPPKTPSREEAEKSEEQSKEDVEAAKETHQAAVTPTEVIQETQKEERVMTKVASGVDEAVKVDAGRAEAEFKTQDALTLKQEDVETAYKNEKEGVEVVMPLEDNVSEVAKEAEKSGMPLEESVLDVAVATTSAEELLVAKEASGTTTLESTTDQIAPEVSKEIQEAEVEKAETSSRSSSKEGERTRKLKKQTTISVEPNEALKEVNDTATTKIEGAEDAALTVVEEITAVAETIHQGVSETADVAEKQVEELKQEGEDIADEAAQALKPPVADATNLVQEMQKSKSSSTEKEISAKNEEIRKEKVAKSSKVTKPKAAAQKSTKTDGENQDKALKKKQFLKPKPQKPETQYDASVEMKSSEEESTSPSSSSKDNRKEHKSFRVLDDSEVRRVRSKSQIRKTKPKVPLTRERSKSEESSRDRPRDSERFKRSKIPTPIRDFKPRLSKSDRYLDRVPILSDLRQDSKHLRSESSMTAPIHASTYSDNERDTGSDMEELLSSATRRKRLKKRGKSRGAKSAGSDYESSNLIDSGFEPSPRSSRLPKWKNMSERGVDMTSVTQSIQSNIRR